MWPFPRSFPAPSPAFAGALPSLRHALLTLTMNRWHVGSRLHSFVNTKKYSSLGTMVHSALQGVHAAKRVWMVRNRRAGLVKRSIRDYEQMRSGRTGRQMHASRFEVHF